MNTFGTTKYYKLTVRYVHTYVRMCQYDFILKDDTAFRISQK